MTRLLIFAFILCACAPLPYMPPRPDTVRVTVLPVPPLPTMGEPVTRGMP